MESQSLSSPADFDSKHFLTTVSSQSGVYRMLGDQGQVIYVGKAKDLKKRLSSYFTRALDNKTLALVGRIHSIEVTITRNEAEALLLEDTLIKKYQPRYNVLLRDDKSYPYIHISTQQEFPRLMIYRGSIRKKTGSFFGPYACASAARNTVHYLHKIFRLRQCKDSYFKNRSRPCLQYQINRCSAPCVNYIAQSAYTEDIKHARYFLEGKTQHVIDDLVAKMDSASTQLAYEKAASYRDQINQLRLILEKQYVSGADRQSIDVLACVSKGRQCCIQVFFFRAGMNQGNKAFYPRLPEQNVSESSILEAFISQYYLSQNIPNEIILSHRPDSIELLTQVLSDKAGKQVKLKSSVRSDRSRWLENALKNASESLNMQLAQKSSYLRQLAAIQSLFLMDERPGRIECFDISHTQGSETVASCVVFTTSGAVKSEYRRFNIKGITPGDDYAAMAQALQRRYSRVLKEAGPLPDLILIDGGAGQLSTAIDTLEPLLGEMPMLVGISKGADRKPGMEILHIAGRKHSIEASNNPAASLLLQQIRDEAHRFAITGHRQRSRKRVTHSSLEDIEGLGPKRRQLLLKSFGGIHGIKRAGVEELKSVNGISKNLAVRIYDFFHAGQT